MSTTLYVAITFVSQILYFRITVDFNDALEQKPDNGSIFVVVCFYRNLHCFYQIINTMCIIP